jgi:hypothetical protein
MLHNQSRPCFHLQKNKRFFFRKNQNKGYETKKNFLILRDPHGTRRMQELGGGSRNNTCRNSEIININYVTINSRTK